jgi:hypothetical protein
MRKPYQRKRKTEVLDPDPKDNERLNVDLMNQLSNRSELEIEFALLWDELYPNIDLHTDYRFCPGRKLEMDFAQLDSKVGIEIQGGIYSHTRTGHSSATGLERDYEKAYLALINGWILFPLSPKMITEDYLRGIHDVIQQRLELSKV